MCPDCTSKPPLLSIVSVPLKVIEFPKSPNSKETLFQSATSILGVPGFPTINFAPIISPLELIFPEAVMCPKVCKELEYVPVGIEVKNDPVSEFLTNKDDVIELKTYPDKS